ncbi:hypothetical protein AHAS_Ahas17G0125000 [Arachis hypogaea]
MWRALWRIQCPPKVKNFLWRALHNGLPVRWNLNHQFPTILPQCPRCPNPSELVTHCLASCSHSRQIWCLAKIQPSEMAGDDDIF